MPRFIQRHPVTGAVQFNTEAGDRMGIILGSFLIDYASNPTGAFQVPALDGARPFTFIRGETFDARPEVTVNGSYLAWGKNRDQNGNYPSTGQWEVIYGGIDLVSLGGVAGAALTLRSDPGNRILFTSLYAAYAHLTRAAAQRAPTAFQNSDAWRVTAGSTAGPMQMIALRPVGEFVAPVSTYYVSGSPVGILAATGTGWNGAGDYFVVGKPTISVAKPGLTTRSAITGELTFSSSHQTVRVVDVIPGQEGTWVGTPGRIYAAIFPGVIGYAGDEQEELTQGPNGELIIGQDPPYYAWRSYALGVRVGAAGAHTLDFTEVNHSGNPYGIKKANPIPRTNYYGSVMIIDVTGL